MALIGELVEWLRGQDDDAEIAEGRFDLGGGDMVTAIDYQPSGHDSQPEPGDFGILVPASESGSYVIAGWVDPWNAGVAKPGEVRLYARSETSVVGALHITTDGDPPDDPDNLMMELIARADRVDAELEKIKAAHNDHTHSYNDSKGSTATATPTLTDVPSSVASAPGAAAPDFQYERKPTGCDRVYCS